MTGGMMFTKVILFFGVLLLIAIIPGNARAGGQTLCGDPDADGGINILDISFMINFIYKDGPEPAERWVCDVNNSKQINILDIAYLINFLYKSGPAPVCGAPPSGELVDHGPCKRFSAAKPLDTIPPDKDCLQYQYDFSGTLTIKHINAGLNCCPEFVADMQVTGNTITITEIDSTIDGGCECLCLFDLDYEIHDLIAGQYTIIFIEPYSKPEDPPLEAVINIGTNPSGEYCVSRCCYPWGL
jgi:hypothetical protein